MNQLRQSWATIQSKTFGKSRRIRVQMMFWWSLLLLIAVGGLLELRSRFDKQLYTEDLLSTSNAVVNDIAAELSEINVLDEQDVENLILTKVVQAPALEEITVYESIPGIEPRTIASTTNSSDVMLDQILPLSAVPKLVVGTRGERLMVIGRSVPGHAGYFIVAATTLEIVDQVDLRNRQTAIFFTLGSIVTALFLLNYIFQRKIGKPLDSILAVVGRAHLGDYTQRVQDVREDEMGEVARSFNEMLDRVEVRTEEKNRLIAEARQGMLEIQTRLIQAERLATAGQMATTFAHEIGSPLASLSAHAELLLEEDISAHQRESLSIMHKQIRRVTQIVDDLLRSARRGPEDFVPVNLSETVREVLQLVLPRLDAQHIKVVNRIPEGLLIRGYALYLQEVFLNLINNAAEAIDGAGVIELTGAVEGGGKIWIEIRDSGPGIDPKIVDDVWKQFVTTKAMRKGTGLGLAVVREIVKQHGGEVSLHSTGEGTVVRVVLPAHKQSMVPA